MSTMVPMYGFGGGGGKGATLTVNAPAGCTVTITKDGKSKTKVAGDDGVVVFKGLFTGDWTCNMTSADGTQTMTPVLYHVTADYETTLTFFAATIHVVYPAGSVCTATDGVTTLTAPDTSGTWDCVVHNAGTWTVSLDSGFSESVTISENGETQTIDKWYVYNNGDEREYITGGIKISQNTGYENASKESTRIYFDSVMGTPFGSRIANCHTSKKISLKHFNTLYALFSGGYRKENGGSAKVFVASTLPSSLSKDTHVALQGTSSESIADGTLKYDISAIQDDMYVGVSMFAYNGYVTKIYLK